MATVFLLGILFFVGLVQAGPLAIDKDVDFIENIRESSARIAGGIEAKEGQIPYQVHLRTVRADGVVLGCGGSVIHNEWVLTAAHCLGNFVRYYVRLGVIDLNKPQLVLEELFSNAFLYPSYNGSLIQVQPNDIGLLKLSISVPYGPTIQPVRLQNSLQKSIDYTNVNLIVSGFGNTDESWLGDSSSDVLLWTFLRGYSNEDCAKIYRSVTATTVCAIQYNATQSACYGDSGGPLTKIDADGQVTQIGVVSFGSRLGCKIGRPTGYIRPGHFHDWYKKAEEIPGIKIFHYCGGLNFASKNLFRSTLFRKIGYLKEKPTSASGDSDSNAKSEYDWDSHIADKVQCVIIDATALSYVDAPGVRSLEAAQRELVSSDITVLLAGANGPVLEMIETYNSLESERLVVDSFPTVHDAVMYFKMLEAKKNAAITITT